MRDFLFEVNWFTFRIGWFIRVDQRTPDGRQLVRRVWEHRKTKECREEWFRP